MVQPPTKGVLLLHPVRQLLPGEVLPDAEAESLGSGRDAWLGWWELMMGPTNQRSRWILTQKNAGCEKKMFTQILKTKPQSRHLDLSHVMVISNYWRCEMMCSCLDGQASDIGDCDLGQFSEPGMTFRILMLSRIVWSFWWCSRPSSLKP